MDGSRFRLDDLTVDLVSGEVRRPDGTVERLQPQPARLLGLLAENAGEVVDRERIREHLWGDQELEFESSLHYCVRQVRSVLGESASEPVFVETLARRGYRLMVRPEPLEDDGTEPALSPGAARALSSGASRATVGLLAMLLLALFGLALTAAPPVVQRLAILPFEPPAGWADDTQTESVPELLLLRLGRDPDALVALGPTSTAGRGADGADLADLVADLDVQWAINGRYIEAGDALPGDGRGVLVELIRGRDGAHVWVEAYPLDADPEVVAGEVASAVSARLVR